MLELARRAVLAACLLIGLWLFFLPDPSPLWTVGPAERGGHDGPAAVVSGPLWVAFFHQVDLALAGEKAEKTFMRRLGRGELSDGSTGAKLYFKYYDPPLSDLGRPQQLRLALEGAGRALDLGAFTPDPHAAPWAEEPPAILTHPWRKTGWKAWPAGLLTALFLPWPARGPNALRWPRRKLLALDACWLGLTGLGFGLPLAIFHGMVFSSAHRIAATAACWALAILGLALGRMAAARAASGVVLANTELVIKRLGEDDIIPYAHLIRARLLDSDERARLVIGWFIPWTVELTQKDGEPLLVRLGGREEADRLLRACSTPVSGEGPR